MLQRLRTPLRLGLGVVFVYAAYSKLAQPWLLFALSIDSYRLLPEWGVLTVARVLPWLELMIGILLVLGIWLPYVAGVATAMLATFFLVMAASYFRGATIDCGCFGAGETLSTTTLVRDALLVAAGVALVSLSRRRP